MLTTLALLTIAQVDLAPLLNRGPLVLVEQGTDSKFAQATGVVLVDADPDRVWAVLVKMEEFKDFMPKVTTSEIVKEKAGDVEVRFVLDVPGPDTDYTVRFTPNAATKTITGAWASGDLKGSKWLWKVESAPGGKALLTHTLSVKNFSGLAQSLEDEQQTVTVGVNVGSVLAATRAVKGRAEAQAKANAAAAK
ncbi:MAG: SRPBCC family protein [Myxococcales bacterium]|nr:SRPBCC family protein [Myxococcales bacterium]